MNILITNDDGPDSFGLILLIDAVKTQFPTSRVVVLTTAKPMTGMSFGVSSTWQTEALMKRSLKRRESVPDWYTVEAKPVDLIYMAFCYPEQFLPVGTFESVFCGVNYGHNVGLDVLHSGTTAQAMIASSVFGAHATAFSQEMDQLLPEEGKRAEEVGMFDTASKCLSSYFKQSDFNAAECYNVNFPRTSPKGWTNTKVAPYSRWRKLDVLPPGNGQKNDIQLLGEGYCTISELDLKINPMLRY